MKQGLQLGTDFTGTYSRVVFDPTKNYFYILKEAGKAVLDDEFNTLQEQLMYQSRYALSLLIGDGSPNTGFLIQQASSPTNDFKIREGNIFIEGWDIYLSATDCLYSNQNTKQPVPQPASPAALTTPGSNRTDEVYIDLYFVEVSGAQDSNIIDPTLGVETARRYAMKWQVKVAEGSTTPTPYTDANNHYHWTSKIATLNRLSGNASITTAMIVDVRINNQGIIKSNLGVVSGVATLDANIRLVQDAVTAWDTVGHRVFSPTPVVNTVPVRDANKDLLDRNSNPIFAMTGEASTTGGTIDLGPVTAGDRIAVTWSCKVSQGSADSETDLVVLKSSGSATMKFQNGQASIGQSIQTVSSIRGSTAAYITVSGIIQVTGSGTLVIACQIFSYGTAPTISAIEGYVYFLKKQ